MTDLTLFGTAEYPLRCSALPMLVRCPWRAAMLALSMIDDPSGKAADTGSAAHKAVKLWHDNGQDYSAALKGMGEAIAEYPLADLHEAELHFRPYTKDPRNVKADIVSTETKVKFQISPAWNDPTGEPIWVKGTLDQIRRENGRKYVWDLKTGNPEGWDMLNDHALQLAGYTLAAGLDVHPGGIIRSRGWRKRGVKAEDAPDGVFWPALFTRADCDRMLDAVRFVVAAIRAGKPYANPGDHCGYCRAMSTETCLPRLRSLKVVK